MNAIELKEAANDDPTLKNRVYLLATSDGSFYPDHDISKVREYADAHGLEVFELNLEEKEIKKPLKKVTENE